MYSNFKPFGIFWNCLLGLYSSNNFYIQYVLVDFETSSPNLTAISQPYTSVSQVTRREQLALKREGQEEKENDPEKPSRGRGRGKGKGRGRGKQPKQPKGKGRASGHKDREEDQDEMDDEEEEEVAPPPAAAKEKKKKEAGKRKESVKPKKATLATDEGKVKKTHGEKKAGQEKTQANRRSKGEEDVEDAMMEDMDEVPKSTSESGAMLCPGEEEKHEGIGVPNGKMDCDEEEVVDAKDSKNAVKVDEEKGTLDEKQDEKPSGDGKTKRRRLRKIPDYEPPEDKKSNEKTEDKGKKTDAPAEEDMMPEKEKQKTQDLQPKGHQDEGQDGLPRKKSRTRDPMAKGKGATKRVLESETGASKSDKAAAKKTKEDKKDPKPEKAVRKRRTPSVNAKKEGHEVDHGAEPKEEEEEDLSKAKCFARRRCPKTGFNRAKWVSLRKAFEEKVKPSMKAYSKAEDTMGYKFGRAGGLENHFPIRPTGANDYFPKILHNKSFRFSGIFISCQISIPVSSKLYFTQSKKYGTITVIGQPPKTPSYLT